MAKMGYHANKNRKKRWHDSYIHVFLATFLKKSA
jgi:hypothetical protein